MSQMSTMRIEGVEKGGNQRKAIRNGERSFSYRDLWQVSNVCDRQGKLMLTGIVKHFDGRDGKLFGFIIHEVNGAKQEIFFHYSFGGMMGCLGGDSPVFIPGVVERHPKSGDVLLFEAVPGPKGLRASKWCFASTLATANQQIESRPIYRLVERRGFVHVGRLLRPGQAKYHVLWEGKNLDDLRMVWPKDRYPLEDEYTFARYFKVVQPDKAVVTPDGIEYPPEALLDYDGDPR